MRRVAPPDVQPVDLQVCVQASLDAAIGLAAEAEGLRRSPWIRKVLTQAVTQPRTGPAPRAGVRLRDGAGRLADDAGLMRALARVDPSLAVPNSGHSKVLRIRVPPDLDEAVADAARIEHQPHGDWVRIQLTRAATSRLGRARRRAPAVRA